MSSHHPSDSAVQRRAESEILRALGALLNGLPPLRPAKLAVGAATVEVDGCDEPNSPTVLVEAYARQGALKGGQVKKIGQDLLKFALLRQDPAMRDARFILAFASTEALASVRGWLLEAATAFQDRTGSCRTLT